MTSEEYQELAPESKTHIINVPGQLILRSESGDDRRWHLFPECNWNQHRAGQRSFRLRPGRLQLWQAQPHHFQDLFGTRRHDNYEREVAPSGHTHEKGVLILSGYLGAKFGHDRLLTLSISLAFEHSYGGIDAEPHRPPNSMPYFPASLDCL